LNVQKRIVRVHLARKHALKFECFDLEAQTINVGLDFLCGPGIRLFGGHLQEFRGIAQRALEAIQAAYDLLELGPLPAEFLSAIRVVPDAGLFELALYFLQTFVFVVVIKDTSSKSRCAPRDL
jgi:hypothetical protein